MRVFIISLSLMFCFLSGMVYAGEIKEIILKDGSVITGEVISLSNGIYTVKSDILGVIKLEDSKIRSIREKSSSANTSAFTASSAATEVQVLQQKMMNDKEIMSLIQSLQNDPEFKKLLEDPAIVKAVKAGDLAALSADPRFIQLLNNPTVHEIQKKVR